MNDPLPYIIANLKANETWDQMSSWLSEIIKVAPDFNGTIIVCPSSPFLAASFEKTVNSKIKIAAQDISRFKEGAYTGEFAASQIASICTYAIIGHSERRQNFNEDNQIVTSKVENALSANIQPIFCIQGEDTFIPEGARIIAYEPVFAIGTGNPDTPENARATAKKVKSKGDYTMIYGGSVNSQNIKSFLDKGTLDGVLVGTKSLDPSEFSKIISAAL